MQISRQLLEPEPTVSKSHLVPGGEFEGTVHSVFATSCNLRVGDLLVTVHDSGTPHTPTSIRVKPTSTGRWAPATVAGERAVCRAGWLSFGRHLLDLRHVPVWAPPAVGAVNAGALGLLLDVLCGDTVTRAVAERHPPDEELDYSIADLARALLPPSSGPAIDAAVSQLVGRGPGLTPSGDDVLVGAMAALSLAGRPPRAGSSGTARSLNQTRTSVLAHTDRTTDVSAHHLRLAARGCFGEPLAALLADARATTSPDSIHRHIEQVLAVGATSGADAIVGVAIGLRAAASPLGAPTPTRAGDCMCLM